MHSLKQQLLVLAIGPLLLLAIALSVFTGLQMKERATLAVDTKAQSDLATGESIIDLLYPGQWEVKDGILLKGGVKINNNFEPVDKVADLTGDTVTIFLGDTRISTTVRNNNGQRAIGTKAQEKIIATVLKNGNEFHGQANVVGRLTQAAYKPIRNSNGKIIGMFYVGISQKLTNELTSLLTMVGISILITIIVTLVALFFTKRVIINPLHRITEGTKEAATGHFENKIEINSNNEIGELANAFNSMVESMQNIALQISKATVGNNENQPRNSKEQINPVSVIENKVTPAEELPKGLHEATMKQILIFLEANDKLMSAEEIGEGANLTRVTARRYLDYLETKGKVVVEHKYGTVGRPVKLYKSIF